MPTTSFKLSCSRKKQMNIKGLKTSVACYGDNALLLFFTFSSIYINSVRAARLHARKNNIC